MSEFKVKTSHVRAAAGEQNEIARQMKQLEDEIWQIQNGLSFEIAQKQQIRQRLRNTRNTVSSQSKGIYDATKALNQIADTYETTEAKLAGKRVASAVLEPLTNLSDVTDLIPQLSFNIPSAILKSAEWLTPILPGLLKVVSKEYLPEIKTKYEWKRDINDKEDKFSYSKNKESLKDSDLDVTKILEKRWENTTSLYHLDTTVGDKEGNYYSGELDFLKQEMYADLYGGLYYTDPVSGERKLRVAAGISAGYTLTALSAKQEARLGNDYLGVYGKVEGTLGRVDGKIDAVVGLHDAEGNFNPTAHAKLAGEAILAEVSGKAEANIFGVDIGAEAKLNVGVGGHAEFGYKDGKLSIDMGASLGIGGSVKLEVDIDGAVNAVEGAVKAAWTNFIGLF